MSVHYKFKAAIGFDTVQFDGLHISVGDLKKAIILQKKLGKATDFDLQIKNAQTKEEYTDEGTLIPKNTSVLVARIPLNSTQQKKIWELSDPNITCKLNTINNDQSADSTKLNQSIDLTTLDVSEEEKIKAMMTQSTQDYDPSKYLKIRGSNQYGPVPPNYRCYKCHQPGHWIKNCPLNQVDFKMEIKKSTGIPRSFMVPVEDPRAPGALMTSTGHFAVPKIDHEAYKEGKKERPPFIDEPFSSQEKQDIPQELLCHICKDLLSDAVLIPCCGNSYCDECIRLALLDSEEHECPDCHEKDVSPDTLIPNRFLRTAVHNFRNETGYVKIKKSNFGLKDQYKDESEMDSGTILPSTYDKISTHYVDDKRKNDYGKHVIHYNTIEARAGTPTIDEEPVDCYHHGLNSSGFRTQRNFTCHSSNKFDFDRRRHRKAMRDNKGALPPVPSYDHHACSNISPLINEPAPPGVDIAPIPDVHRPPPPLIMPPVQLSNRSNISRNTRNKFKSYGLTRYNLPGTIDDPLEAFERIMKERDERDRKMKSYRNRRSRSRSGSFKHSDSSGSWKHSPGRSHSRSPKCKRRKISRSWSRSHSISPKRYTVSPRCYFGEMTTSPNKGYSNYLKSVRMYDNRRNMYTEELYRDQYRCIDSRSYDLRNEFIEYKNYRNPTDEVYLENDFVTNERRQDFIRNYDGEFSAVYNSDYYREYDIYSHEYDYCFSRHKDQYIPYTVSYPTDHGLDHNERFKREIYNRDEKNRSSDRRSSREGKFVDKSVRTKQSSKVKKDKESIADKKNIEAKISNKMKEMNTGEKIRESDRASPQIGISIEKKNKVREKKRRKKERSYDIGAESDKNKRKKKKDRMDKNANNPITKSNFRTNPKTNNNSENIHIQKDDCFQKNADYNNENTVCRESDDDFSTGRFISKQYILNKANSITIKLKETTLLKSEKVSDSEEHVLSNEGIGKSSLHNEIMNANTFVSTYPDSHGTDLKIPTDCSVFDFKCTKNPTDFFENDGKVASHKIWDVLDKSSKLTKIRDKKMENESDQESEHHKNTLKKVKSERRKIDRSKFLCKENKDRLVSEDKVHLKNSDKHNKMETKGLCVKKKILPAEPKIETLDLLARSRSALDENVVKIKSPRKSRKEKNSSKVVKEIDKHQRTEKFNKKKESVKSELKTEASRSKSTYVNKTKLLKNSNSVNYENSKSPYRSIDKNNSSPNKLKCSKDIYQTNKKISLSPDSLERSKSVDKNDDKSNYLFFEIRRSKSLDRSKQSASPEKLKNTKLQKLKTDKNNEKISKLKIYNEKYFESNCKYIRLKSSEKSHEKREYKLKEFKTQPEFHKNDEYTSLEGRSNDCKVQEITENKNKSKSEKQCSKIISKGDLNIKCPEYKDGKKSHTDNFEPNSKDTHLGFETELRLTKQDKPPCKNSEKEKTSSIEVKIHKPEVKECHTLPHCLSNSGSDSSFHSEKKSKHHKQSGSSSDTESSRSRSKSNRKRKKKKEDRKKMKRKKRERKKK